ncbi:hypothetical protein [Variovorax sp. KK3]|uniref:hypothetical protein n=1 Tax=Variovorax sp. KK3 TaxID=1855728 RepID=UPI00117C9116|nr:hypothetical protein [Variovorax sp. KK3]
MSVLSSTMDLWRAAERTVEEAEHSWLTAVYSSDVEVQLVQQRHVELVEARAAAQILFAQSLNETAATGAASRNTA